MQLFEKKKASEKESIRILIGMYLSHHPATKPDTGTYSRIRTLYSLKIFAA